PALVRRPTSSPLAPYTTLFRSSLARRRTREVVVGMTPRRLLLHGGFVYTASPERPCLDQGWVLVIGDTIAALGGPDEPEPDHDEDRKSTRLNSSHVKISYAVFC